MLKPAITAMTRISKMIQINMLITLAATSEEASGGGIFRWGGGAEKRSAKMSMLKSMGNQATPAQVGPNGTIQNWAAMPVKKRIKKSTTIGIMEALFLYGENKKDTITAKINAPKIPIVLSFIWL
jgi:hypothetical protein